MRDLRAEERGEHDGAVRFGDVDRIPQSVEASASSGLGECAGEFGPLERDRPARARGLPSAGGPNQVVTGIR